MIIDKKPLMNMSKNRQKVMDVVNSSKKFEMIVMLYVGSLYYNYNNNTKYA